MNKKKLIIRYFPEHENLSITIIDFKLVYKDNIFFKFLMFPKFIYRDYFLHLITPFSEEVINVSIRDKDEIKRTIYEIYNE